MRLLLVSTYELGHQPLHLASPAAALEAAGHEVRCVDVAVEPWSSELTDDVDAVAFSVPMHTAMRLAMKGAEAVKRRHPGMPVCFYGLYATVSKDRTLGRLADRLIAGEYERELVAWADGLRGGIRGAEPGTVAGAGSTEAPGETVDLRRTRFELPVRGGLPPLERYARLAADGEERTAGYVEATHGCAYRCRHCPVPVVYDGRTRKVSVETVVEDVARQVEMGAEHITFGDPDFLNRWRHALEVTEAVGERFPHLTYDMTTKVEHVLRYRDLWDDFARTGCLFVVSAFETTNGRVLELLDKGHTREEMAEAVHVLRAHGIDVRPSWLPFTPWTELTDVVDILDFIVGHDLVDNVDPVQLSIRLLIPEGSLVLDVPEIEPHLGPYDDERLTYTWRAADPRVDELQEELAELVERNVEGGRSNVETFLDVREAVMERAGVPEGAIQVGSTVGRPRLTEPWFC